MGALTYLFVPMFVGLFGATMIVSERETIQQKEQVWREKEMNYNMYSIERIANDINAERIQSAKNYRLWQKARKSNPKPTK